MESTRAYIRARQSLPAVLIRGVQPPPRGLELFSPGCSIRTETQPVNPEFAVQISKADKEQSLFPCYWQGNKTRED